MRLIRTIYYFFTFFLIILDGVISPSFSTTYFGISSELVLVLFVLFNLLHYIFEKKFLSQKILDINRKYLFPFSVFVSLLVIISFNSSQFISSLFGHSFEKIINLFVLSGSLLYFDKRYLKYKDKIVWLLGPAILLFTILIYHINSHFLCLLIWEDGPFEYMQAIIFFVCFIYSLRISKDYKSKKNSFYSFLFLTTAVIFFLAAFEEISWGQRLLNIETPEFIEEINYQKEISIHNLNPIQKVLHKILMMAGLYGSFASTVVKQVSKNLHKKLNIFFPSPKLFFYFFPIFIFYFIFDFLPIYYEFIFGATTRMSSWHWQEVAETHLAIGFFLHLLNVENK